MGMTLVYLETCVFTEQKYPIKLTNKIWLVILKVPLRKKNVPLA